MTSLRQKMIDLMTFRQFSPKTHQAYLSAVTRLSAYYHRSPEQISADEVMSKNGAVYIKPYLENPETVVKYLSR